MVARFIIIALLMLAPSAALAQGTHVVSVPGVWAHNGGDETLAAELTTALRSAIASIPGWTDSGLDYPLSELMRACDGEVEAASDECLVRMAIAREPAVDHGLVVISGLFRDDVGTGLTLEIALLDGATGRRPGVIRETIERVVPVAERNRLAAEWLHRLSVLVSAPRVESVAPRRIVLLGFEAMTGYDGDTEFAREFTLLVRQSLIERSGWSVDDRMPEQATIGLDCPLPSAECATVIAASNFPNAEYMIGGEIGHEDGTASSDYMVTLDFYTVDAPMRRRVSATLLIHPNQSDMLALARQMVAMMETGDEVADEDPYAVAPPLASIGGTPPTAGSGFDAEYAGWPLIGLAAFSLAMEIVSWSMIDGITNDPDYVAFRSSFGPGAGNVCGQPSNGSMLDMRGHALCSSGADWENVEIAFGVIGGAALAGGIIALVTDVTGAGESHLTLRPQLGPTRAGLEVGISF